MSGNEPENFDKWLARIHAEVLAAIEDAADLGAGLRNVVVRAVMYQGWELGEVMFVRSEGRDFLLYARLDAGYILHLLFEMAHPAWRVVAVTMPDGSPGPDSLPDSLTVPNINKAQATEAIEQLNV